LVGARAGELFGDFGGVERGGGGGEAVLDGFGAARLVPFRLLLSAIEAVSRLDGEPAVAPHEFGSEIAGGVARVGVEVIIAQVAIQHIGRAVIPG
jgi:hypothetical protein